jgi:hypothetical protein
VTVKEEESYYGRWKYDDMRHFFILLSLSLFHLPIFSALYFIPRHSSPSSPPSSHPSSPSPPSPLQIVLRYATVLNGCCHRVERGDWQRPRTHMRTSTGMRIFGGDSRLKLITFFSATFFIVFLIWIVCCVLS